MQRDLNFPLRINSNFMFMSVSLEFKVPSDGTQFDSTLLDLLLYVYWALYSICGLTFKCTEFT